MLSCIIPSYKDPYLAPTVAGLLASAGGQVEVIVVLDGYWTDTGISDDPRVRIVHLGKNVGMRGAINAGARIAKGKYIMKSDAHCLFSKLFDARLIKYSGSDWISVPRLYDLDVKTWERNDRLREFQYIERGTLKGKWWPEYKVEGDIVDLMTMQGSCWFMERAYFEQIGGLDDINYGGMGREAQELSLKAWTTGGRVVLNRKVWYAHWNKPAEFSIGKPGKEKSIAYAQKVWTEDKLKPLVDKFKPPSW